MVRPISPQLLGRVGGLDVVARLDSMAEIRESKSASVETREEMLFNDPLIAVWPKVSAATALEICESMLCSDETCDDKEDCTDEILLVATDALDCKSGIMLRTASVMEFVLRPFTEVIDTSSPVMTMLLLVAVMDGCWLAVSCIRPRRRQTIA